VFGLRRIAIGLVAAALAIGQAVAGESQAAAAAESWSWTTAAGDGVLLVAAPRAEARAGRLVDPPPPARLAWPPPSAAPALIPPQLFTGAFAEPAFDPASTVVTSGRSARGPPAPDAN
jgi:hypothetical protein